MSRVKRVIIVLSQWCPHCVPLSLEKVRRMAGELGVPLRVLDIDVEGELREADALVEGFGDFVEDYLIPQVFLEFEDGRVAHVFTGFSEGVAVTEGQWERFFASCGYWRLLTAQKGGDGSIGAFVGRHLAFHGRCRRHCEGETAFVPVVSEGERVVGAYTCPGGFVSTVVCWGLRVDLGWFLGFLRGQLGVEVVRERDLRVATRYGWELGESAVSELGHLLPVGGEGVLREVYWTAYPQGEEARLRGVSLCGDPESGRGCKRLFVQALSGKERLCPSCRLT